MTEETKRIPAIDMNAQLTKLGAKFPPQDIEWRVMKADIWGQNLWVRVYPYLTARAIHQRLDDVVGPGNWCNSPQVVTQVGQTKDGRPVLSVQVGISIRIGDQWVTKYNVSEPSAVEPAKGAFSGAEKRAGEEWGIGRYLWFVGMLDAETTQTKPAKKADWVRATLPEKYGKNNEYWWKPPRLPAWALPRDPDAGPPVTEKDLSALKKLWILKMAPGEKNPSALWEGFSQLVTSEVGKCPVDYSDGWTHDMIAQVRKRIEATKDVNGPSPDVPFE